MGSKYMHSQEFTILAIYWGSKTPVTPECLNWAKVSQSYTVKDCLPPSENEFPVLLKTCNKKQVLQYYLYVPHEEFARRKFILQKPS